MPKSLGSARKARKARRGFPFRSITNAAAAECACDACRGRLTTIRLETRGRASPSSIATTALSPAVHGPVRIVVVIHDEGVEQAFGLRNFRISGLSPADGYATEDDLSCAILSALSRPLPASAINYFLRLHQFTRSEFLVGRDLDDDLTLDQLCKLSLIDLLPPIREARVESFEDDCLVVKINYLSPAEYFAAERLVQSLL